MMIGDAVLGRTAMRNFIRYEKKIRIWKKKLIYYYLI